MDNAVNAGHSDAVRMLADAKADLEACDRVSFCVGAGREIEFKG